LKYISPITNINNSMSFHTSYMTCLPQELILAVFDMCYNVSDVINLAESDQYVFDIYKANINKVVSQLIINNKKKIISDVIRGAYFNAHYKEDTNDYSIDTKLDIVKKIGNYLSNTTPQQFIEHLKLVTTDVHFNQDLFHINKLFYNFCYMKIIKSHDNNISHMSSYLTLNKYNTFIHYVNLGYNINDCFSTRNLNELQIELVKKYIDRGLQLKNAINVATNINEDNVEKLFELYEEYSLSIRHAITMLNDFNETQIEKTKRLIHDENLYSEIAFDLVEKFNDAEIELFIKLSKILIKEGDDNDNLTLRLIAENHRDETELNIMIKLAENNFETDSLIYITNELIDLNNIDESSIMKCIELKNKGISEEKICNLVEADIYKEFDYEYYESLISLNHSPDEAIRMIIAEHEE